jgi:exodeoxyribonuclease VII small subunit
MSKSRSPSPDAAEAPLPTSYEAALAELEQLLARLEAGQLPLDDLLTHHRRGAALLAFCRDRLQAVENQIRVSEGENATPWNAS